MNYTRSRSALAGALAALIAACLMGPTGGFPSRPTFQTVTAIAPSSTSSAPFLSTSTAPSYRMRETDAAADEQRWTLNSTAGQLRFRTSSDDQLTVKSFLTVDRTGTDIDLISFLTGATPTTALSIDNAQQSLFSGPVRVEASTPRFTMRDTDEGADARDWGFTVTSTLWEACARLDNGASDQCVFNAQRGAGGIDSITFGPAAEVFVEGEGNGVHILTSASSGGAIDITGDAGVSLIATTGNVSATIGGTDRDVATVESGSYTGTVVGCTTSPTVTIFYTLVGRRLADGASGGLVSLLIPAVSCTSNTTSLSITGAPASITPNADSGHGNVRTINNGAAANGRNVRMSSGGTLIFREGTTDATYTAANAKGVDVPAQLTYSLDNS